VTPPPASVPPAAPPALPLPLLLGVAPPLLAARRARWRAMRCAGPTAWAAAGAVSAADPCAAAAAVGAVSLARLAGRPLNVLRLALPRIATILPQIGSAEIVSRRCPKTRDASKPKPIEAGKGLHDGRLDCQCQGHMDESHVPGAAATAVRATGR